ncbi:MAG TPA: GIY-YIG nuclease family protein [Candidatus Acidoferrales bacterium]|nr:GIY-YIG nuclease family protein [Candidatus Acidoferrales bacterium]
MQYFVYMVRCSDGSFYVGVTNDVERRINEHNFGLDPSSYTHERRPVRLVYSTDFQRIEQAIAWEKQLKGWSRAKKIALIDGDWERIVQLSNDRPSTSSG